MRSPTFAFAFVFAVAFSGYAFADPQPLTRADCEKASMTWNDSANVCGSSQDATDSAAQEPSGAAALRFYRDSEGIFRFPDQLVRLRIGEPIHHCIDLLSVEPEEEVVIVRK